MGRQHCQDSGRNNRRSSDTSSEVHRDPPYPGLISLPEGGIHGQRSLRGDYDGGAAKTKDLAGSCFAWGVACRLAKASLAIINEDCSPGAILSLSRSPRAMNPKSAIRSTVSRAEPSAALTSPPAATTICMPDRDVRSWVRRKPRIKVGDSFGNRQNLMDQPQGCGEPCGRRAGGLRAVIQVRAADHDQRVSGPRSRSIATGWPSPLSETRRSTPTTPRRSRRRGAAMTPGTARRR